MLIEVQASSSGGWSDRTQGSARSVGLKAAERVDYLCLKRRVLLRGRLC